MAKISLHSLLESQNLRVNHALGGYRAQCPAHTPQIRSDPHSLPDRCSFHFYLNPISIWQLTSLRNTVPLLDLKIYFCAELKSTCIYPPLTGLVIPKGKFTPLVYKTSSPLQPSLLQGYICSCSSNNAISRL